MTIDKTNLLAALQHSRPDDADAFQPEEIAGRGSGRVEDVKIERIEKNFTVRIKDRMPSFAEVELNKSAGSTEA